MIVELPSWLRGRALLGQYQGDYVALATNAQGQLFILIQGVCGVEWAEVYDSDEGYILALASFEGKLYAGTRPSGKVLVYDGDTWAESYDSDQEYINCLAVFKGKLYAGGATDGKIFAYDGDTWAESYDSDAVYIQALVVYDDKLYAVTGPDGKGFVYDGDTWAESFDSDESYLLSAAVYEDKLYIGTYPSGAVLTWDGTSLVTCYDSDENYINSLGVYGGKLYAGTRPSGKVLVYDGVSWAESYDSDETLIRAMAVYEGNLYAAAGTGGKVFVYNGDAWSESYDSSESSINCLEVYVGRLYAGGSTNGKVFAATTLYRTLSVDEYGQLVMVPRGQSGNYMLVDANGYLAAMFKAEFQGSPYNVACDADGRLKFFLTDNVDQWGRYLEVGNAELAARVVGPVHAFNRTGQIIYWTTFEDGAGPWQLQTANGGAGALLTTDWLQGGKCYNLTTAGGASDTASITLPIGAPVSGQGLGFACWVRYAVGFDYFKIRFRYYDGSACHQAYARFIMLDEDIAVYIEGPDEAVVGSFSINAAQFAIWHYFKLTIDLSTGKYIALIWDGDETDLSAYTYYQSATTLQYLQVDIGIEGLNGTSGDFRIDCPVLTCRES